MKLSSCDTNVKCHLECECFHNIHLTCIASFQCLRKVEEEMATLSNMAETVNNRLAASTTTNPDDASQGSGEGVDLDNLFSFLSNMESERHVLDEITRQMDELAVNVDEEVSCYFF